MPDPQVTKQLERWTWGIIVALATIILTGGCAFLNSFYSQVQALEVSVIRQGEKLASLEAQSNTTEKRLQRIESKLDQLLERSGVRQHP